MFKSYIQKKLEKRVQQYLQKHPEIKLVVVTGSVGKTTTKNAIATILSEQFRVRMRNDNHNTGLSAPVAMLGIDFPVGRVKSVWAWLAVLRAAKRRVKEPADVDVIVQELGTDRPGEIAHFGTYLRPAIAVVTAVTPEHMEFFGTIETVAKEELEAANFSEIGIINRDDIDGRFAEFITDSAIDTYGTTNAAEYYFETGDTLSLDGYKGKFNAPELPSPLTTTLHVLGEHSMRPVTAAMTVACKLGMLPEMISRGAAKVRAVHGRMNVLEGANNSLLIDDTYNSSPAAVTAALQTLYSLDAPQRIAILGDMNELGAVSADEHRKLGEFCDPALLAWVITVGKQAETYLAPAARARGCQVKTFMSPIDAGAFARKVLEEGAVVLAKGSQGGIYTEEALKILLRRTEDDRQLVRQSPEWMKTKQDYFDTLSG
jgi:UDP-N-acetylmuramoyl-tripeptide--D-alanyl-D-alanine ligase